MTEPGSEGVIVVPEGVEEPLADPNKSQHVQWRRSRPLRLRTWRVSLTMAHGPLDLADWGQVHARLGSADHPVSMLHPGDGTVTFTFIVGGNYRAQSAFESAQAQLACEIGVLQAERLLLKAAMEPEPEDT